ncbi:hypothetical protein U0A56_23990, partial [Escherichia coli]|nr:hypothetical protein [Escherichia coli]
MLKTIRKHGITLALFAAGSTGLTAAINQMTKTTIAEQASLQQEALFDQVLPAEIRIPIYVMIIASVVSAVQML